MGFCRRCGEIVFGTRCVCGGTAVAAAVPFNLSSQKTKSQDGRPATSTQPERSPTRNLPAIPFVLPPKTEQVGTQPSPTKKFPRPNSFQSPKSMSARVSAHIDSTISKLNRPPSPLKHSSTLPMPESDILPSLSLRDNTLSKVYGSVLQPKESLATHSCASCSIAFVPDATIYPDPSLAPGSEPSFLCKGCYADRGGSKGTCPVCTRPVLTLKAEGGFVHAADKYWHKQCFNCEGCFKNIGNSPMVDLLGRPSCVECFDTCLNRDPHTPKRNRTSSSNSPLVELSSNIGGMSMSSRGNKSRESSPALLELEQRLGITRSREGSPALEDLSQRLSNIGKSNRYSLSTPDATEGRSPSGHAAFERRLGRVETTNGGAALRRSRTDTRYGSGSPSPSRSQNASPSLPTGEAVEEMKQRFLNSSPSASPKATLQQNSPQPLRVRSSLPSRRSSPPPISPVPDLYDHSDSATQSSSSGPGSPPRNEDTEDIFSISSAINAELPRLGFDSQYDSIVEETPSQVGTPVHTPKSTPNAVKTKSSSTPSPFANSNPRLGGKVSRDTSSQHCAKCRGPLFSVRNGGKYVTVPDGEKTDTYHPSCFTCAVCDGVFKEGDRGQAIYVKANGKPCHVECAPSERKTIRKSLSSTSLSRQYTPSPNKESTPIRQILPSVATKSNRYEMPLRSAPATATPTMFPRGGNRISCPGCFHYVSPMERGVVSGPQGTRWHSSCLVCGGKKDSGPGARLPRAKGQPGCGKKLDSAAKTDGDGGVWCRECLLLLGVGGSPLPSPTKGPLTPSFTGTSGSGRVGTDLIGTTTLARQLTGMSDGGLLRHLTGGGPRSTSPTKQLGMGMRPRPKSVIGMRSSKSIDEGRGMFLVRQLTGARSAVDGE